MKTRTIHALLAGLMAAVSFTACDSVPETTPIDAKNIQVSGATTRQLAVADEIYRLNQKETSKSSGLWIVTMRIKLSTCQQPLDVTESPYLALVTETGERVDGGILKIGDNAMDTRSAADFRAFAKKDDGSEQTFCFYLNTDSQETVKRLMTTAKSFVVYVGSRQADDAVVSVGDDVSGELEVEERAPKVEALLPASLKGSVEVVDVSEAAMDDDGFPEISVTFRLVKKVSTASLSSRYGQLWIVGVGQDERGVAVKELLPNYGEWRSSDADGKEFKEFLEGEPETTITMTFHGDSGLELFEKDQAKIDAANQRVREGCERVAKFKLTLKND